ncbi:hypothetical protein GCM10009740_11320 [Terrabacter terrae]|uniref:Uncharacterized protein n=1 Tax=Terrabacter terrae TaxID=318434 RepID=A0ABN2TXX8_9MICO
MRRSGAGRLWSGLGAVTGAGAADSFAGVPAVGSAGVFVVVDTPSTPARGVDVA